jgi:hypothetical protein
MLLKAGRKIRKLKEKSKITKKDLNPIKHKHCLQ